MNTETETQKTYPGDGLWEETRGKRFQAIGENRSPLKGEFFLWLDAGTCAGTGTVCRAMFDFKKYSFPIMREVSDGN